LKAVADLCVNCHQCRLECPANVDIPKVVLETKAQYVAASGLPWSDWLFTRLDALAAWGSWLRPLANWSLGNRQARWVLEKFFGLSRLRKLPRLERRSFLRVAQRQRWTRSTRHEGRRVLYVADTFANWFDTSIAEATVRVLKHNGVAVFVHPDLGPSGMAAITAGDVERVLPLVRDNIKLLAEAVRQGYTIVTSEPSTALCLTREYPHLVDDDDARLVAANPSEVCAYLWRLHESGKLELDFEPLPLTVGYHLPCHTRAVSQDVSGQNLLRLIPGLMVRHLDHGCSGMAGTYGLKRDHVRGSLRAGRGLIRALRDDAIILGSTECSACKVQMRQGTTKPTVHPIKLLAVSYGLLPDSELTTDRHESDLVMS
ncbi:MAG: heterodisulfide reductase-related iron-sulfur binding cluster, partial [Planctomycetota bacterium]